MGNWLLIDDEEIRYNKLKEVVAIPPSTKWVNTAYGAFDILDREQFDVILLDGDLDTFEFVPYTREISGVDVAKFLTKLDWKPKFVFIISMNPVRAAAIKAVLDDAGIPNMLRPYKSIIGTF